MNASKFSGICTNTQLFTCMLALLFSIIVHYFINNNYYNISTDVEKCPFCYGTNLCATFDNKISFTNLTISEKISNLINIKNVYIAHYNNEKVVLKKLGHNWELQEIDKIICEGQNFENFCPPYIDSYSKDYTNNILEFLSNINQNIPPNFHLCSKLAVNYFIDSIFSLYTHINTSVMTANIWTTLLANVEPLLLQLLDEKNGWPVPKYYGSCGRIIIEEFSGKSLHSVEHDPWILRANLALQLLKSAEDFTNKHPVFRFYLTDISSDNIVVTDEYKIKFIDLENVIISEKLSQFDDFRTHESKDFCDNCYAFSTEEICSHSISDHNFYSICQLLLSKNSPWPMMSNGLLHSPPENILKNYPNLFELIETCAKSSKNLNRFEAVKKLIQILEEIV